MRIFIIITLSLLYSSVLWAQLPDRFSIYQQNITDSNDVTMSAQSVQATHQFYLGDSTVLNASLMYSALNLQDENTGITDPDDTRNLYTLVPSFNAIISVSNKNNLITFLRPGFYGDGEGNMGEDFRVEGGFVYTQVMSDKLTMGLGLARGTNLGRDLIVPLLQFSYYMSDKVTISGVLPVRASIWYIHSDKWQFGGVFRLEGSVYNIDDSNINGAQAIGIGHAFVGGATRYHLFDTNFLSAEAGVTALRRYEWTDNPNAPSTDIGQDPFEEREMDGSAYIRVGWEVKY